MIPRRDHFLEELAFFFLQAGLPLRFDEAAIFAALTEAACLASAERDEPAALFYACARRAGAFGGGTKAALAARWA
jgi:hypothetical protein